MDKKTVRDVSFKGKKVLARVDFNVPIKEGKVDDDTRIRATIPTIQHVLNDGGAMILTSHLGRPDGQRVPEMSLRPAAERLSELLGKPVRFADDCVGDVARAAVKKLQPGEVLVLENVRFHKAETAKDDSCREFAKQLAEWGDLFVNDAFGSAHRPHASVSRVTEFLQPAVAGFLLEKEIEYLVNATTAPERPFVAILGGAKVSDKIKVIENLLPKVDALLIGGAMAYTFLASQGKEVGKSLVEKDQLDVARKLLKQSDEAGGKLLLPVDHVVAEKIQPNVAHQEVAEIPADKMGLDIGSKTRRVYADWIAKAKTVVWNGPMGVFETPPFQEGTEAVAKALAESGCKSIIGGGDSVSAINKLGFADKVTHLSTGGGASLEVLEGKQLPGLTSLSDRD